MLDALDIDSIVTRTTILYGKQTIKLKPSFPLWVIGKLRKKETIKVVMDQYGNPTYADNLAEAIFALYEKDARGIFHAVGKDSISRYNFAVAVARKFKLDPSLIKPVTSPELNQIARRPEKLSLSLQKMERVANFKMVGVEEGLTKLKAQLE